MKYILKLSKVASLLVVLYLSIIMIPTCTTVAYGKGIPKTFNWLEEEEKGDPFTDQREKTEKIGLDIYIVVRNCCLGVICVGGIILALVYFFAWSVSSRQAAKEFLRGYLTGILLFFSIPTIVLLISKIVKAMRG